MGVYIRRLEQRCMEERKELEDTTTLMVGKKHIILLCRRNIHGNDSKRKQHFLQHKGNHSNNKEAYTDGSKSTRGKKGFAAVFVEFIRRGALPKEASIHTAKMTTIEIAI